MCNHKNFFPYLNYYEMKFSKIKKTDKLVKVLKSLDITDKDFLSSGCTATVFKKNNQAVKVCGKDIRYFSGYKGNAQSFKKHVNSLGHIFLPINEILHEESDFFIYTQDLCQPLEKSQIDKKIVAEFLQLFKSMIEKNCMVSGLSPGNLCLYNGQVLIYDYHGLHPLDDLKSSRVARNLVKYMTMAYCPKKFHDHKVIMANFDKKSINKLNHLPSSFIDLLKVMLNNKLSINNLTNAIDRCIENL